jgi:hypothetical protein
MVLNGPNIVLDIIINCLERAQTFSWEVLPAALDGPSTFLGNAADLLGRAQQYS